MFCYVTNIIKTRFLKAYQRNVVRQNHPPGGYTLVQMSLQCYEKFLKCFL